MRRGDVYLVMLNPARGDEIRNMRPCLVVSPDELNSSLNTFIVAPMTNRRARISFSCFMRIQGDGGIYRAGPIAYSGPQEDGTKTGNDRTRHAEICTSDIEDYVRALGRVCPHRLESTPERRFHAVRAET